MFYVKTLASDYCFRSQCATRHDDRCNSLDAFLAINYCCDHYARKGMGTDNSMAMDPTKDPLSFFKRLPIRAGLSQKLLPEK